MIWPFCPLDPMLWSLNFRTDRIRAFSADQRIRLLDIPRRTYSHQYKWTPREYERARAMMRDTLPGPFEVPDWSVSRLVTVADGASAIAFDNTSPAFAPGDSAVLIQDSENYEAVTIATANDFGVTLAAPVGADYEDAALLPLLECDASEGLSATRSVQPIRDAEVEWACYSGEDIADDGGAPVYRTHPVLIHCSSLGEGSIPAGLTHPFDTVDNGISRPFVDTKQEQPVQRFGAAWQTTSRAEQYALVQWFHYLKGRQRAFWIPDMNSGLTLASNMVSGAATISIRNVGFASGYGSGDLFLRTAAGTVYTIQVASSVSAGANETLTLTSPAPANVGVGDVDQLCLMFLVTLASDRIEFLQRSKPGPRIVVDVEEVP